METHRLRVIVSSLTVLFCISGCDSSNSGRPDPLDGKSRTTPVFTDEDRDSLNDEQEDRAAKVDTDQDGTPDYLDLDSDNDNWPDQVEAGDDDLRTLPYDADGDGTPNFRDEDADGNGIADLRETTVDLDVDGILDVLDLDDDGDGILDAVEVASTPEAPPDFDGDLIPNYRDIDSDNDTISDFQENVGDGDRDGQIASVDLDTDGDGIPDQLEAGDALLQTAPFDTDADGFPDVVDLDSDNDGLADKQEDKNGNGRVDEGETSALLSDTDNDKVSDLVEIAAGSNPQNPTDNPKSRGGFVFIVPFEGTPDPNADTLDFSTKITKADVVFAMDTTASMGEEINNLKATLTGTIVPRLATSLPDLAMGVGEYHDFTLPPSTGSDYPWKLLHRVMTVKTPAGIASIQQAINGMQASGGEDWPESGWEALYQLATGSGTNQGLVSVPPFDPLTAPPSALPTGENTGTLGGMGFRTGALPIAVMITDAINHNSTTTSDFDYTFPSTTFEQAASAFEALGGKMVGISSRFGSGSFGDVRRELTNAVTRLQSVVKPNAWDSPGRARPAGCGPSLCCTGANGDGISSMMGKCPLVFDIEGDGSGLGTTVVQAIETLTNFAPIDISTQPRDDQGDSVDAVKAFIGSLRAKSSAQAPCTSGLTTRDQNGDGVADTYIDVKPGTRVCFDVVPKTNTTVKPTHEPQMFRATIIVVGDNVTELDRRDVFFVVPPKIEQPKVN